MKKLFGMTVVLAASAYVGFKGFVWYEAFKAMDQLKEALAPHAALEYRWISSSLNGEVSVEAIRLRPFRLKETISIGALVVKAPDALRLIKLGWEFQERLRPPDALEWRLDDVRMGLVSPVIDEFVTAPLNQAMTKIACGNIDVIGPKVWKELGYEQLVADLKGGYRFDRAGQTFKVDLSAALQAISRLDLEISVKLPQTTTGMDAPRLESLRIGYQDDSYMRRIAHFCRRQARLKEAEYFSHSVHEWEQGLARIGIGVTGDFRQAYRLWLEGNKRLLIEMAPKQDIDYAALLFIQPAEVMKALGVTLRVDGFAVRDLALRWDVAKLKAMVEPEQPAPLVAPPKEEAPVKPQLSFKATEFERLNDYIDYPVRVDTAGGRLYEGKLVSVQRLGIEVGALVSGGMVTYPVPKSDIERIEVYR